MLQAQQLSSSSHLQRRFTTTKQQITLYKRDASVLWAVQ
jgi:hypothetical protein